MDSRPPDILGALDDVVEEVVEIKILPSQMRVLESCAEVISRPAGYGSGKSWGLVLWAVTRARQLARGYDEEPLAGILVEPTKTQVRRVLVPRLREVLRQFGIDFIHKEQAGEFHLDFGDGHFIIYLGSTDRPETLEGPTLCFAGVDEAGLVRHERAFRALNGRLRESRCESVAEGGWGNQLHLCGTPEGRQGPFYEWSEGETARALGTVVIRASSLENVFLPGGDPEAYVRKKLGHLTGDEARAYIEGYFIAKGGRILGHFDDERNIQPIGNPMGAHLYMFCDFGARTVAWCFAAVLGDTIHIFDELIGRNTTTETQREEAVQKWMDIHREFAGRDPTSWERFSRTITVICDETSNADIGMLRQVGFDDLRSPNGQNPGWRDRAHTLNQLLRQGRLLVDKERAPVFCSALRDIGWGKHGKPEKRTDDGTGEAPLDHPFDAAGYGAFRLFPIRAPRANDDPNHTWH